jgi:hypothetical protein
MFEFCLTTLVFKFWYSCPRPHDFILPTLCQMKIWHHIRSITPQSSCSVHVPVWSTLQKIRVKITHPWVVYKLYDVHSTQMCCWDIAINEQEVSHHICPKYNYWCTKIYDLPIKKKSDGVYKMGGNLIRREGTGHGDWIFLYLKCTSIHLQEISRWYTRTEDVVSLAERHWPRDYPKYNNRYDHNDV